MIKNTDIIVSSRLHKTLALLSDIHYTENYSKKRLQEIYFNLKEHHPDYICIVGDFFDQSNVLKEKTSEEIFMTWLEHISKIAPVIISIGNHDVIVRNHKWGYEYPKNEIDTIASIPNVSVLDNDSIVRDNICFLGYTPPYTYYDNSPHEQVEPYIDDIDQKLKSYLRKDCYQILLCHTPIYVTHPKVCETEVLKSVNLVLSGHMHKGIIPLKGNYGLISPCKKFFPKYAWGDFTIGNRQYVISGGVIAFSNVSPVVFHLFNFIHPPHIEYIYSDNIKKKRKFLE